jgi:hypothetical protein
MTDEKYNEVVYIIENWDNPEIQRQHRIGYSLVKKYTVRSKKDVEGNLIKSLYIIKSDSVKEGDNVGRKLLRCKEMFDAIYDAHYSSLGHLKSSVTWREVNRHVYNITKQHVNEFITVCPVCIHAHPQIPKSKGARCPIHSGEFCDRMQIDLIDYQANERRNVYGQVMR